MKGLEGPMEGWQCLAVLGIVFGQSVMYNFKNLKYKIEVEDR